MRYDVIGDPRRRRDHSAYVLRHVPSRQRYLAVPPIGGVSSFVGRALCPLACWRTHPCFRVHRRLPSSL